MDTDLEFGILGPLEVRVGGAPVWVGGPRQRALLAVLLCNANRVVSRDELIDELLSDQPAGSAERMLRVQVSRLRKVLADGDSQPRLLAQPPGYLLRVEHGELDLHAFDQRVAAGRHALEEDDPGRAAALLREAESLWRGRPLADLEFESFARFEVQRLEALRMPVVEDRIDAELALGQHAALCAELEQLVAEHPLRERLRGQLMVALYRSGRQADALEAYTAGRSLLVDELAVEPGPQLKQLQMAVLEQDPALDLPQPGKDEQTPVPASLVSASPTPGPASPGKEAAPGGPGPEATPRRSRRRRARSAVVALGLGTLAVVAIAPLLGHAKARGSPTGNLLALVSPGDGALRATVPLRAPPTDVAAGSGSVWVAEADAGLVVRVDPTQRAVTATIPVGTHPSRIVTAPGQIWVLDSADQTLSRIDPQTDTVPQTIALRGLPGDVLASAGSLWVADRGDGTVLRLDPSTGRTRSVVRTGGEPSGLAAADGAVWVATDGPGTVGRINIRTGAVTAAIRAGDAPAVASAGAAGLWVLDPLDATVSQIDPRRDRGRHGAGLGVDPPDGARAVGCHPYRAVCGGQAARVPARPDRALDTAGPGIDPEHRPVAAVSDPQAACAHQNIAGLAAQGYRLRHRIGPRVDPGQGLIG